ncbi:MAG: serine/threonine protein kinase [Gomphosphaeria aponina SAG 52.96 = DSM 107014]|uniref:non-specific serine/threonine protein kinase n=1 Tax=Gomphosphaeria aponina SAG 52.96 = DSM 107014 TaxID=1521640 RepID=A0A941GQ80_9CHRO|nr:serine/threonine protein kinase [Gomphosphaeria aponina SAG 52.96 = DSM 107014]
MLEQGKTFQNVYKIIKKFEPKQTGAFGENYLAEKTDLFNEQVVIKRFAPLNPNPATLKDAQRLFNNEAKMLHELGKNHDQIPRLIAYIEDEREFYIIQEYIEGNDLSHELEEKWNEDKIIELLLDLLPVLEFVHAKGAIHRDIKPANLIRRNRDNKIVLIDFGAVKIVNRPDLENQAGVDLTTQTIVVGTLPYMPLEQLHGRPCFCSDIYALGVTAIQFLTGQLLLNLKEQEIEDIQEYLQSAGVSEKLASILSKMVEENWRNRFQSAPEVLKEFNKIQLPYFVFTPSPEHTPRLLPLDNWRGKLTRNRT